MGPVTVAGVTHLKGERRMPHRETTYEKASILGEQGKKSRAKSYGLTPLTNHPQVLVRGKEKRGVSKTVVVWTAEKAKAEGAREGGMWTLGVPPCYKTRRESIKRAKRMNTKLVLN